MRVTAWVFLRPLCVYVWRPQPRCVNCCGVQLQVLGAGLGTTVLFCIAIQFALPCVTVLQSLSSASSCLKPGQQQMWLADRSAVQQSGLSSSGCVPEGVESALVQSVPGGALLLVLAERPR